MWTKPYGKTGKDVSVISFGGMRFPEPEKIDEMAELVVYAHQKGINYFDTAPYYCQDKSEDIMGAAFKQMEPGTFYTSTKCGSADGDQLRASLEKSLKRLGQEKITFFHIWCVLDMDAWQSRKDGGAVQAALKAKEEGLVEHVVVSSHMQGKDLGSMLSEGFFEGVTLGYCAINFPYREEALRQAGKLDLGVVTMNPLGGGLIPDFADRFNFIQGPEDPSVVAAALRFNVSNPNVTSALVGFSTKDHVDQAIDAVADFEPYPAGRIDQIRENVVDAFDGLCTGCGYCLPCPEGVEIPKMMDAYNLYLLYDKQPKKPIGRLKYHWGTSPEAAQACSLCGACETRCTQHLPIGERLQEIQALSEEQ
jgi:hypothetical protein